MIRRLRRRMILLVLCGLLLASAGLVFAINYMNWRSLTSQAAGVLEMLSENNGQRPSPLERWEGGGREKLPDREEGGGEEIAPPQMLPGRQGDWDGRRGRSDTLMNAANLSNSYTIYLDREDNVTGWFSDRPDLYSDEDIQALAAAALSRGGSNGRVDTQFYRLIEQDEGKLLIVVDERLEMQSARNVLRATLLVALAEDALLSVGAVLLIRRMVKPVDEAMEKQKQFVWDASHELKTPLAVISANAEVLAGEVGESKPLQYIQSEVERTDHLLQNLLTLARMEKGTAAPRHEKFDLSRALLSVALPFESSVFEAGKTMEINIPDDISFTGDEEMIKQLAVILLSNAEKYSNPGGRIVLSLEARGEKRVLKVHNTGPAIPAQAQERIFDRFYRVDSSHNREIAGNGLGLAIARQIVDAHKGKITVQSAEGEGTAFTVNL